MDVLDIFSAVSVVVLVVLVLFLVLEHFDLPPASWIMDEYIKWSIRRDRALQERKAAESADDTSFDDFEKEMRHLNNSLSEVGDSLGKLGDNLSSMNSHVNKIYDLLNDAMSERDDKPKTSKP